MTDNAENLMYCHRK